MSYQARLLASLIMALFYAHLAFTQNLLGDLEGRITDGATDEPLQGANVIVVGTGLGDASDTSGHFNIHGVPAGKQTVEIMMIGYDKYRGPVDIHPGKTVKLLIELDRTVLKGERITVEAEPVERDRMEIARPTFELHPQDVEEMAGVFENVLRTLQTLPGVVSPSDFSNQLVIRGGGPEQNLIIMDDVEIFDPYLRSAIASMLNPAVVENVTLYGGAFPVIFGDRLSSVLAVRMREGSRSKRLAGRIGMNVATLNIVVEGKTNLWNGAWLLSGRRSYYDRFAEALAGYLKVFNEITFPSFEDVQAKLVLRPSPDHQIKLIGIHNKNVKDWLVKEELGEQDSVRQNLTGGDQFWNNIFGVTWQYDPTPRFRTRLFANIYRNNGNGRFSGDLVPRDEIVRGPGPDPLLEDSPAPLAFSTGDTVAFRYDQRYAFRKVSAGARTSFHREGQVVEVGAGIDHLKNSLVADVQLNEYGMSLMNALESAPNWFGALADSIDDETSYSRWYSYVQNKWVLFDERASVQLGLRYDHYGIIGGGYLMPRLDFHLEPNPATQFWLAWGHYSQSPGHEKILDSGVVLDLARYKNFHSVLAEKATHTVAGFHRLIGNGWELSLEAYQKDFEDLIVQAAELTDRTVATYASGAPAKVSSYVFQQEPFYDIMPIPVNDERGKAYGLDFLIEKEARHEPDQWDGRLSYALSHATRERTVEGRLITIPFDYDRRHSATLVLNRRLGSYWKAGLTWRYGTGFPYTPALRVDPLTGSVRNADNPGDIIHIILSDPETGYVRFVPDFGAPENINSRRLPDYHRLDIRVTYMTRGFKHPVQLYLDLINVYNRKNVLYYRNIIMIEDKYATGPSALHFPKPVLYREPVYMFPFMPSFGLNVSF